MNHLPWKSVETDGLPPNSNNCLIIINGVIQHVVCSYERGEWMYFDCIDWSEFDYPPDVTHWLEITPPNPQGTPRCENCKHKLGNRCI